MNETNVGLDIQDLLLGAKDGLRAASELGFHVVEISAADKELDPAQLSTSGRRHLLRYTDGLGLRMDAIAADLPGLTLTDPQTVDERVERTRRIIELASEVHVGVVTASAGALTHPETGEPSPAAVEALMQLGACADACGVVYALRPTCDDAQRVDGVLQAVGCPAVRLGIDPAAMVMSGANPMAMIQRLPEQIALTYARDATAGVPGRPGVETRWGEGEVDFVGLLAMLSAIDFGGPCILRRMDSTNPAGDLRDALQGLQRLMPAS